MRFGFAVFVVVWISGCNCPNQPSSNREACIQVLEKVAHCPDFWVKVHAIEYLIETGEQTKARQLIGSELAGFAETPQKRIGYWRTLYANTAIESEKQKWLETIQHAYLNTTGPDRIHAAETLAKLSYSFQHFDKNRVVSDLASGGVLAGFVRWGLALPLTPRKPIGYDSLLAALKSTDQPTRKLTAYALSFIGNIPPDQWPMVAEAALDEPKESEAAAYLLGTAYSLASDQSPAELIDKIRSRLFALQNSDRKSDRIELCRALAEKGKSDDVPLLLRFLNRENPIQNLPDTTRTAQGRDHPWNLDVQAAAAYALLQIEKRDGSAGS